MYVWSRLEQTTPEARPKKMTLPAATSSWPLRSMRTSSLPPRDCPTQVQCDRPWRTTSAWPRFGQGALLQIPRRTATPLANHDIWRHSTARREHEALFLNGPQRSVNRKVQGSNPWSGAKSEYEIASMACDFDSEYSIRTATPTCSRHLIWLVVAAKRSHQPRLTRI